MSNLINNDDIAPGIEIGIPQIVPYSNDDLDEFYCECPYCEEELLIYPVDYHEAISQKKSLTKTCPICGNEFYIGPEETTKHIKL